MDIVDTRDLLSRWLGTCDTGEQVFLFAEVVEDYIVKRFEGEEPGEVIYSAKATLLEEMDIQLTIINQKTIA